MHHYYSPDSLERNRSLYEQSNYAYNTRSLDRFTSKSFSPNQTITRSKSKPGTTFAPDRPFYPPSKYPNFRDKTNVNLNRLLETREKYKTPESRRALPIQNIKKSTHKRPNNQSTKMSKMSGSVPTLNLKKSRNFPNDSNDNSKGNFRNPNFGNEDQMNFSPEIGTYSHYYQLDTQSEFETYFRNQMSASYYYPKTVPNRLYHECMDKMAQSLHNESLLASKIQTGSLKRATRNNCYSPSFEYKIEEIDRDDSPTKSYSFGMQCNSLSQDSLDR